MKQLGLTFQLISTPSLPTQRMKGCTTPLGFMPPTLYEQQCGFFYVPQESKQRESCDRGPMVFRPYLRRLENLTVCRCNNKGSTFSSVVLRPQMLVWPWFEHVTSRSADRCLRPQLGQENILTPPPPMEGICHMPPLPPSSSVLSFWIFQESSGPHTYPPPKLIKKNSPYPHPRRDVAHASPPLPL